MRAVLISSMLLGGLQGFFWIRYSAINAQNCLVRNCDLSQDVPKLPSDTSTSDFVLWPSLPLKEGYGVVYTAYSQDVNATLPKFLQQASRSAFQLKQNNPEVPVAIVTNADNGALEGFDYVIKVSSAMLFNGASRGDGLTRQWFTRIFYLAHSPFQITLAVDASAAFPTTSLLEALEEFENTDIDIATANNDPNGFNCHNFEVIFRWNRKVKALFLDWMVRQLFLGIAADDQFTLCQAMYCAGEEYGLNYGAISSKWAAAWLSFHWKNKKDKSNWRHRTTRVVDGNPQICHSEDVCDALGKGKPVPRVAYFHSRVGPASQRNFYSQREIEESKVLPYNYTWEEWKVPHGVAYPVKGKCHAIRPGHMIEKLSEK